MRYLELAPAPELTARVECLWSLAVEDDTPLEPGRVFPDGCIELIVHLGPPWSWRAEGGAFIEQPAAFVVGQLTRPFWLRPARGGRAFGARLRAAGARALLHRDLGPLCDTVTALDELWDDAGDLLRSLREAADDHARADAMGAALRRHDDPSHAAHPRVRAAVETILAERGGVRIADLARAAGFSERHFPRRFERGVGCMPRQFARTVRFQHLLDLLGRESKRVDWAGLAWDSGFADQAHLIREFRRFTGATPGSLEDEALTLARRFVSPERLARYFARGDGPD